jgi:hypothetical protein
MPMLYALLCTLRSAPLRRVVCRTRSCIPNPRTKSRNSISNPMRNPNRKPKTVKQNRKTTRGLGKIN